jgi:hypothetical protein
MHKSHSIDPAVCSDGRCDLNDLPCLRALNLARQMARASGSLGQALPEAFSLDAHVDIVDCLRPCRLTISLAGDRISVSREGVALASADLQIVPFERRAFATAAACATVSRRAH